MFMDLVGVITGGMVSQITWRYICMGGRQNYDPLFGSPKY